MFINKCIKILRILTQLVIYFSLYQKAHPERQAKDLNKKNKLRMLISRSDDQID